MTTRIHGAVARTRRLVLAEDVSLGLRDLLRDSTARGHEGIAYLLGLSDGATTVAVTAVAPRARTTRGSFFVGAEAMATVVRAAADHGLHIVGQVHTHPGEAYHSEGDELGAKIAYTGYVSIVLPEFGRVLPSFCGAAAYMFDAAQGFVQLTEAQLTFAPRGLQ